MRIPGISKLHQTARRVRNRFSQTGLILLYHRVTDLLSDPQSLCVTPNHFAEHLEILHKQYRPISLQQLVRTLRNGNILRRSVVVAFDDGYADNFHNAKCLLERYEASATVFVTTGYIGHKGEFWWDELDRLLLQPGVLPGNLNLSISGSTFSWELGEWACYSEDAFRRYCRWNVLSPGDPTTRQSLYRALCQLLRRLPKDQQIENLDKLVKWAGAKQSCRQTHNVLSPDEISRLAQGGLVEVGAHTVSHLHLASLPTAVQNDEIKASKAHLEEIIGQPVNSFSYPYGSRTDYTNQTIAIVKEAGFTCACANFGEVVLPGTDCFKLPRFIVRDYNGDEFARCLEGYFLG